MNGQLYIKTFVEPPAPQTEKLDPEHLPQPEGAAPCPGLTPGSTRGLTHLVLLWFLRRQGEGAAVLGRRRVEVVPEATPLLLPVQHVDGRVLDETPEHEDEARRHPHVDRLHVGDAREPLRDR